LFPLLRHGGIEPIHVERQPLVPDHVTDDIDRKTERVIKFEDDVPGDHVLVFGPQVLQGIIQNAQAMIEGLREADFLVFNNAGDIGCRFEQFRVGRLHDGHDLPGGIVQEGLCQADIAPVPDGAAHNSP
jgi:hypothetical protein